MWPQPVCHENFDATSNSGHHLRSEASVLPWVHAHGHSGEGTLKNSTGLFHSLKHMEE